MVMITSLVHSLIITTLAGHETTSELVNAWILFTTFCSILMRGAEIVLVSVEIDQTPTYDIHLFE